MYLCCLCCLSVVLCRGSGTGRFLIRTHAHTGADITPFNMFRGWPLVFKSSGDSNVVLTKGVFPILLNLYNANNNINNSERAVKSSLHEL